MSKNSTIFSWCRIGLLIPLFTANPIYHCASVFSVSWWADTSVPIDPASLQWWTKSMSKNTKRWWWIDDRCLFFPCPTAPDQLRKPVTQKETLSLTQEQTLLKCSSLLKYVYFLFQESCLEPLNSNIISYLAIFSTKTKLFIFVWNGVISTKIQVHILQEYHQ